MVRIYEDYVPHMSLRDLALELVLNDEMFLSPDERIGDCRVKNGDAFLVDLHLWKTGEPPLVRTYETDIQHLRDIGVGGTAKYIAFGRDKHGDDVLYTFM